MTSELALVFDSRIVSSSSHTLEKFLAGMVILRAHSIQYINTEDNNLTNDFIIEVNDKLSTVDFNRMKELGWTRNIRNPEMWIFTMDKEIGYDKAT